MIGFFPDPYPDELIYSICARFQERVGYSSNSITIRELFGRASYTINVALPHYLNNLISALPPGHHYTVDRLIDEHTLLPFFSPFLEPERVSYLRECSREDNGMRLGIPTSNIRLGDWFKFCPLCAKEDKKQFGEFYWHRLHQLSGVKVCHVHNIFLENSKASTRGREQLLSAEQAVTTQFSHPLDASNPYHEALLKIARDAAWLLVQPNLVLEPKFTRNRYLYLLEKRGLAKYYVGTRVRELLQAFRNYYPPDFLKLLNCELDYQDQYNWLFRLVRPSTSWAQPALHHLLLIQFLGYTAEEFFTMPEEPSPFGKGPWPCLNPACEYFRQPQIEEITYTYREGIKLTGTFSCACGFVYTRNGPDQSPTDQFRFTRVKSYGSLWESALRQLWNDSTLSFREVVRRLGVDYRAVKFHASYLGLSFPRPGLALRIPIHLKDSKTARSTTMPILDKLETYRSKWLAARKEYPGAGRDFLRNKFQSIYVWLRNHDQEWLKAHLSPIVKKDHLTPNLFGEGPWPCLNPACQYFRQPQIENITTHYYRKGKFTGIFSCTCGFVYTRTGPDQLSEDRFRFNRVKSYGSLWESTLRQLWNDSTISLSEIVRRLGVDYQAVKRHASYLELSFPRLGPTAKVKPIQLKDSHQLKDSQISMHKKLETYRSEWLAARKEHPEAGRNFLKYKFQRIYGWLNNHDKEWLKAHLPPLIREYLAPSPFGEGPWPCLNPTCQYFRQPQIESITTYRSQKGKFTGTFSCACGFVYTRTGPDQLQEDCFRFNGVRSYGPLWESTLRQLWDDSTISLSEIARQLGVNDQAVKHHASYLELSFPRLGPTVKVKPIQLKDSQMSMHKKLETYRSEWLAARKEHPEVERTFLKYKFQRIYGRLNNHDKEWLKAHLPPPQPRAKSLMSSLSLRVDWESRDAQLAEAVKFSAERLRNVSRRPVRITKSKISNDLKSMNLNNRSILNKKVILNKLPLTAKVLAEVVETREEYAIRRVWWAASRYRQENIYPTQSQISHRASLNSETAPLPRVKSALDAALQSLAPLYTVESAEISPVDENQITINTEG